VLIWDVRTQRLIQTLELPLLRSSALDLSFIPGSHDLVANTPGGVVILNADTGRSRQVRKLAPPFETRVSTNGRRLLIEQPAREADLWLMEIRK
jgi:hypothetical protein